MREKDKARERRWEEGELREGQNDSAFLRSTLQCKQ